ncbi:hypothetical protein ACVWZK_001734 [Bradyrhizobium sp. GM0.4]
MNRLYPLVLEHRLPSPVRYGISAGIMGACAMLQTALQMQTEVPGYFLLLPGVFLSGLIFDRGAGIFAAVIAVGVGAYIGSAGGFGLDFLATNSLFAITAAGTAIVAEFQRAELRRVMLADKTKAVLLQEMAHRTKNNLAILSGMIRLEARHGGAEAAAALEAARRLQVMAEVYDHLSLKEDSRSVNMRYFLTEVVDKVFQSLAPSGPVAFKGALRGHRPAEQPCAGDRHDRERTRHERAEVCLSRRPAGKRRYLLVETRRHRTIGVRQRHRSSRQHRPGWTGFAHRPAPRPTARR